METKIIIGATYRHYNGSEYIVTDIAVNEATFIEVVIYHSKQLNYKWVRPASEWFTSVDEKNLDLKRFTLVDSPVVEQVMMARDQFIEHAKIIWDNAIEFAYNIRYGEFRATFDETIKSILK